jgi:hypothetical protein
MTPMIPDSVYFTYQFGVNDPSATYPLPVMTNCDGLGFQIGCSATVFNYVNASGDTTGVFSIVSGSV